MGMSSLLSVDEDILFDSTNSPEKLLQGERGKRHIDSKFEAHCVEG